MKAHLRLFFIALTFITNVAVSQNYQALHGSSFAGSLASGNNPASIVHVPYAWDITPVAVQLKHSTNAFRINNYSLLSSPKNENIQIYGSNGTKKRFLAANQNIRLFNTRINLNAKSAIAFGLNIRSNIYAETSNSNWQDTLYTLADYLQINTGNTPLSAAFTGNSWAEFYASYAHTLFEDEYAIVTAGISFKLNRAIAGAYAIADEVIYSRLPTPAKPSFNLTSGSLQYGYSSNLDLIDSGSSSIGWKKLLKDIRYNPGFDIGVEFIKLTGEDKAEGGDYAYETKLALSVMDIGQNRFTHGQLSRLALAGKNGITDSLLENKFSGVNDLRGFNDSLASISESFQSLNGDFSIYQPTRLIINLDKHIAHNFFVNTELTLPIATLFGKNSLVVKDLNLLAVTPRWELKSMGAFLPVTYSNQKQLWVGAAFKAGPLLLGTHNLANIFSKYQGQSGGVYLAITLRPGKDYNRYAHFPAEKKNKKAQKMIGCPVL